MLVEVCANSLESALNAEKGGADRIELCAELGVGGITPSYGLIASVLKQVSIPLHVLIRPRSGHFTYSKNELAVMLEDIKFCKKMGVAGIVSGILKENFKVNYDAMEKLLSASDGMHFTFHRAFDWVPNAEKSLKKLRKLGVQTILTSGQQTSAELGIPVLKIFHQLSNGCEIMAGGGINATNANKFKEIGLQAIHLSGTAFQSHVSTSGKIPMNSAKHLNENQVGVTNTALIRQIVQTVK